MKTKVNGFDAEDLNLIKLAREYSDETKARELFEAMRWPNGPVCPHCKNHTEKPIYKLEAKANSKTPARNGVYKCGACRKQFTATVGSIMEDSHAPIVTWLQAIFILCSSKKSISANQLHRMLGVTYKTAWFMAHRIRYAMGTGTPNAPKLSGTVEMDETFVGGRSEGQRYKNDNKTIVAAIVERGGAMRAKVIPAVTAKNVGHFLAESVEKSAIVNTDEHGAYRIPARAYARHDRVVHSRKEYARIQPDGSMAGINHCESFFSLLKRGVFGAWHSVSREHLPKYCGEFEFRWNTRKISDGERMLKFFPTIENKRLMYRRPAN